MSRTAIPYSRCSSADQIENLRLDGDVERRRRLVCDQQARITGERHGDHHALAHAAGHFMRIGVDARRRIGNLDAGHQCDRFLTSRCAGEASDASAALRRSGRRRASPD